MRKMVLGAAAVATLLAAWFAPDQDGGVVGPASATTRVVAVPRVGSATVTMSAMAAPPASPQVPADLDLRIAPRTDDEDPGNAFAKQSWAPAAPLKVMPEQTAGTVPDTPRGGPAGLPPLPFQFMGRFVDEGKTAYFLQIDGQNVVARPGQKINDSYLPDSVSGDTMNFIYLPLNQKQTLVVGDTN